MRGGNNEKAQSFEGLGVHRNGDRRVRGCDRGSRPPGSVDPMMVMSLQDLVKEGFPKKDLQAIANSEDFAEVGFRGEKAGSKIYFYPSKLEKYLERRTNIR